MKNGIARSAKLSMPVAILSAAVVTAAPIGMVTSIVTTVAMPMLTAMGTLNAKHARNVATRSAIDPSINPRSFALRRS